MTSDEQHGRDANRARVAAIREHARSLFTGGAPGIQVASALSEGFDRLVVQLWEDVLWTLSGSSRSSLEEHSALVAIGGTGRGDMAPYSDIDLLFLHRAQGQPAIADAAGLFVRNCWDAHLKLGHSIRTLRDTLAMTRRDPHFATSLMEARLLWGHEPLLDRLMRRFQRSILSRHRRSIIDALVDARTEERDRHGATVRKLEPDVKKSLGGLRDCHLIRWVGFVCFGSTDVNSLRLLNALSRDEARHVLAAQEFLTRVRIDLHFNASQAAETLSRTDQLRIADQRQIDGTSGQRPVERFMQSYFRHSAGLARIANRFVAVHRPRSLVSRVGRTVLSHRSDGIYRIGPETIDVVPAQQSKIGRSLERCLRLYRLASLSDVEPSPELVEQIHSASTEREAVVTSECASLFMDILSRPGMVGRLLRSMASAGLLHQIIPDFAHAEGLLQFNQYHSYTVDEHSFRAVEAAESFTMSEGDVADAYRDVRNKDLLHLALLLHDLGKGFPTDHSEVGRSIADRIAIRLSLPQRQRERLVFLVHRHLQMSHLALRRDIADPDVLLPFSHEVGSPEVLRMLYVLTAADITAVGPGVWTDWKADLIASLYHRTLQLLGGAPHRVHTDLHLQELKRSAVETAIESLSGKDDSPPPLWIEEQIEASRAHYVWDTPPEQIALDLHTLYRLRPGEVVTTSTIDDETGTLEFRVMADAERAPGCFHKLAGTLTAMRLSILGAQINTTDTGMVVDSFRVVDRDLAAGVSQVRIDEVRQTIAKVVAGEVTVEQVFQQNRRFETTDEKQPHSELPVRVVVDNDSSDACTIIEVFAHDRSGLLYTLAHAIYGLQLSVVLAKIATHFDQVVDVFYVTDENGEKVEDAERLEAIRRELTSVIQEFDASGYRRFVA